MRFVPCLIPVGLARSIFNVRRFVLTARAGAVVIFVSFRFWIPFGSFNRRHMGTQSAGIRSPCLGNFVSAFSTGRGVALIIGSRSSLTARGGVSLTTPGPLLPIAGSIGGCIAMTTPGPLLPVARSIGGCIALTARGFLSVATLLAGFASRFTALLSPAL